MRIRLCPIHALLVSLVTALSPALSWAQFQEPTSEELKMTSDPKAPGAAAVYLYREEKTDDLHHFHSYYERIKVLTEKGKDLATVRIPYEHGSSQVAAIEGRTIHSDGTVIRLVAKPSDLMDFKNSGHQYNQMVFTLPSVELGSILEYRLQVRYDDNWVSSPLWEIQQPYFVRKAHYFFIPDRSTGILNSRGELQSGLLYSWRLPPSDHVIRDGMGYYTLDMTDIPALPEEDWTPPLNNFRMKVAFYYTSATNGPVYWAAEQKAWAKSADHFTSPGQMKKQVAEMVAAGDSEETKARKIYAAVAKLDNWDYKRNSRAKENKDAASVWKQQGGSSDDLTLLYVALARAAGLQVWPMQVVNRNRATFEETFLSTNQLDDYIAVVQINGKEVYLDPGDKMCPFGILNWKHEAARGFRLNDKDATITQTPFTTPSTPLIQRSADLTLDDHGGVTGTLRLVLDGQQARYWRQQAIQNEEKEVISSFNDWVRPSLPEGVQADFDHFDGMCEYDSKLTASMKVTGTLGTATGKRLILPGVFFESRGKHPFVQEASRLLPVDLHYATMEQDDVMYHMPEGLSIDSALPTARVEWAEHASLKVTAALDGHTVKVARTFVLSNPFLDPDNYSALRNLYMQMAKADQQQIVFTHKAE